MDFVAVLGDVFTDLLQFVKGAPRLPVQEYPRDFVDYITSNNVRPGSGRPTRQTVIDIQQGVNAVADEHDVEDVQGNVLRGFGKGSAFRAR